MNIVCIETVQLSQHKAIPPGSTRSETLIFTMTITPKFKPQGQSKDLLTQFCLQLAFFFPFSFYIAHFRFLLSHNPPFHTKGLCDNTSLKLPINLSNRYLYMYCGAHLYNFFNVGWCHNFDVKQNIVYLSRLPPSSPMVPTRLATVSTLLNLSLRLCSV
jgi:hypothetical protein